MSKRVVEQIKQRIGGKKIRVIFPEAANEAIFSAAHQAYKEGFCLPVFLGIAGEIARTAQAVGISEDFFELIPADDENFQKECVSEYFKANSIFSEKRLNRWAKNPLYLGAMCLALDKADAMVCGINYATAEVVLAGTSIVGLAPGVSIPSSFFLMDVPSFNGSEGSLIVLSDGGVCENPSSEELADIAITTAHSAQSLLGWEPRVAMLAYSTLGSSVSDLTKKMSDAVELTKEKNSNIKVDGEMQLDAAIVPAVGEKKLRRESDVAGKANILIVPDLNAGNILYKSIQRFAQADAYGPLLQGFAKVVNDLSRGSTTDDVFGVIAVSCAMACQNSVA